MDMCWGVYMKFSDLGQNPQEIGCIASSVLRKKSIREELNN